MRADESMVYIELSLLLLGFETGIQLRFSSVTSLVIEELHNSNTTG
jgi:hypothetical protein